MVDLNANDIEHAAMAQMIAGSARSMGLRGGGVSAMAKARKRASKPPTTASIRKEPTACRGCREADQGRAKAKFDETVEIAMNLGIDPRQADQRCAAWCLPSRHRQDHARRRVRQGRQGEGSAKAAGADLVGAEDLAEKVNRRRDQFRPRHRHPGHDGCGR